MSFESANAVFVHFPKSGGSAVHWTAEAHGRKLRSAGHVPASWFGVGKPSWVVLRDPFEWYVSLYRFCVDTDWSVLAESKQYSFAEFVWSTAGLYTHYYEVLEIEKVDHAYPYSDLQGAYALHVGPEKLERRCVSQSECPLMDKGLRKRVAEVDAGGIRIYNRRTKGGAG